MSQTLLEAVERRRYFRVDDEVALTYRVLTEEQLTAALSRLRVGYPDKLSLASAFASTSGQMRLALDRVRKDSPDIASYLV